MPTFTKLLLSSLILIVFLGGCQPSPPTKPTKETATTDTPQQTLGCVTLYEHINFQGRSKIFCENRTPYVGGDFNDIASSVKADCSIQSFTLHEHANHEGRFLPLQGCSEIGDIRRMDESFNDIISSLTIQRK